MQDSLGNRMKLYENHFNDSLIKFLPAFARLDGKAFHSFCRDLRKPYDERLSEIMYELTLFLVKETGAKLGYTQSDEITLTWYYPEPESQMFFDGKINKLNSVLASMATLKFRELCVRLLPEKQNMFTVFDCRTWNVPNIVEGANVFVWREQDATRNSIQMAARSVFPHKECQNKSCPELQEMLFKQKGINWNDYPSAFKKGTYIGRIKKLVATQSAIHGEPCDITTYDSTGITTKKFDNPFKNDKCQRGFIQKLDLPIITKIKNRHEVIYLDVEPIIEEPKK